MDFDFDWTVPSVSDGFPVTLGGGTDDISFSGPSSDYTGTLGVDGLLGAFDRFGATAVKLTDTYGRVIGSADSSSTALELAKIQNSTAVAKAQAELAAAQKPFFTMPNMDGLKRSMTGDTVMIILGVVGLGLSIMALKK